MSAFLECGPFSASDGAGRVLLDEVSVSLEAGQCIAIEGPSGGGKSTLLRHLAALTWSPDPTRRLGGRNYRGAELPAWRSRVNLLAQDAPMLTGSVLDNLSFPFAQRAAGDERKFDGVRAAALMTQVGLEKLPFDREVRKLSGGERHRLALIRALLWNPTVLVADEPLSGLDPGTAETCFDLLLRFGHRADRLLICVLHDPEMNVRADRRLRLVRGRLETVG